MPLDETEDPDDVAGSGLPVPSLNNSDDTGTQGHSQCYFRPLGLHPSGCTIWSNSVVTGTKRFFAYASTLSTYVYDANTFKLCSLLGGNVNNIAIIAGNPKDENELAVFTVDGYVCLWDLQSESKKWSLNLKAAPRVAEWDLHAGRSIAVGLRGGTVVIWDIDAAGKELTVRQICGTKGGGAVSGQKEVTAMQWHPGVVGKLMLGWSDGSCSIAEGCNGASPKVTQLPSQQNKDKYVGSVVDVQWDGLSGTYLIIGYSTGTIALLDADRGTELGGMERRALGLVAVRWMEWAPGSFISFGSKSSAAKIWNVSQDQPIDRVRLGSTGSGFNGVHLQGGSRSGRVLSSFKDGSISLYCLKRRCMLWGSRPGHTETIFCAAYQPTSADTLATCSYDATVKVWHTPTMDLKLTLEGKDGVIYAVAWSPDGVNIATGDIKGVVRIWNASSGKSVSRLTHHKKAIYRVHWHPVHVNLLASSSADGTCIVFNASGAPVREVLPPKCAHYAGVTLCLTHPSALFGCEWCPTQIDGRSGFLATACKDGIVRIFDIFSEKSSGSFLSPIHVLKGHTARAFHVHWSPLLPGILASGGDDHTVRIWDLESHLGRLTYSSTSTTTSPVAPGKERKLSATSSNMIILKGHQHNVRPLLWSSEVPWLLLSGSWDSCIRAWDIRGGGKCIAVFRQHIADVYGLAAHPDRPFVFASVSRDTTLVFSTLEGVATAAKIKSVVDGAVCITSVEEGMENSGCSGTLCGTSSRALSAKIKELRSASRLPELYHALFQFFGAGDGCAELWRTVKCEGAKRKGGHGAIKGAVFDDRPPLPAGLDMISERVIHDDRLLTDAQNLAAKLEGSGVFLTGDRRLRREERMERAASLRLVSGNLQQYCENMVKMDRWSHALAIAPGVSIEYWRGLASRYAEHLMAAGALGSEEGAIPFLLAAGQVDKAMEWMVGGSDLKPLMTLAKAAKEGAYSYEEPTEKGAMVKGTPSSPPESKSAYRRSISSPETNRPITEPDSDTEVAEAKTSTPSRHRSSLNSNTRVDERGSNGIGQDSGYSSPKGSSNRSVTAWERSGNVLSAVRSHYAERSFLGSEPVISAGTHLATGALVEAISVLCRGLEVEMAYGLVQAFRLPVSVEMPILLELARRAECAGDVFLAMTLLSSTSDEVEEEYTSSAPFRLTVGEGGEKGRLLLAARFAWLGDRGGASALQKLRLPPPRAHANDASKLMSNNDILGAVVYFAAAGDADGASRAAISELKKIITNEGEGMVAHVVEPGIVSVNTVRMLRMCLRIIRAVSSTAVKDLPQLWKVTVLAYASFIGALVAGCEGYPSIVGALFHNAITLVREAENLHPGALGEDEGPSTSGGGGIDWLRFPEPMTLAAIRRARAMYSDTLQEERRAVPTLIGTGTPGRRRNSEGKEEDGLHDGTTDLRTTVVAMMSGNAAPLQKHTSQSRFSMRGAIVAGGSSTPSAAGGRVLRREYSQIFLPLRGVCGGEGGGGPQLTLEDGGTTMNISDAVMWSRVCPFSPLNTGARLDPI